MRIVRLREEEDSSFVFGTMSVKRSVFFSKSKLDKKFQTVSKVSKKKANIQNTAVVRS